MMYTYTGPIADEEGNVHVGLINDNLQLGLYWKFPIEEMPIVTHWQHFHRGTYVTGIEPRQCQYVGTRLESKVRLSAIYPARRNP